jgi:hypothetical protein
MGFAVGASDGAARERSVSSPSLYIVSINNEGGLSGAFSVLLVCVLVVRYIAKLHVARRAHYPSI